MRVARLAGLEADSSVREAYGSLDASAPRDYRELAALLAASFLEERPRRIGIGGGQGAGKSTLAALLPPACAALGLRACVLSLDDFYLERRERQRLAERVHPLLATRGPPGTHDMALCADGIQALLGEGEVRLPVFDKGLDDRTGHRVVAGPFDLVVLEGWCVGARPLPAASLEAPINDLEAERDPDGVWRGFVNESLERSYAPLWDELDVLVQLRVPSLAAVRRWRLEQEGSRPPDRRMDAAAVARFVAHYERVTRSMLERPPGRADWVVTLDESHGIHSLSRRPPASR